MTKNLRMVKTTAIILLLFCSVLCSFTPITSAKVLTFSSILEITYDTNATKGVDFHPSGPAVLVPIKIRYKAVVPSIFLNSPLKLLIFGIILPPVPITLTIENRPDWATVSIVNPNPVIDSISNEFLEAETAIVIAPLENAPAENWFITVKAEAPRVARGRVEPSTAKVDITFQPGYTPDIDIRTENPVKFVGPQETATFPIEIQNLGNKKTRVTARILDYPQGWTPLLPNTQITIAPGEVGLMSFSITPPFGFGWHNEYETITLEFTPEFWPPAAGSQQSQYVGSPVIYQVTVRNRGISTPGFEFVILAAALGLAAILATYIKNNKKNK
ncbi:MAG: hypothetical protein QXX20_04515 [Candidatus Thermoplasmatota archaeon]